MSDESPARLSRYDLADRLEIQAKKLEGVKKKKIHFVDDESICVSCKWAHITRSGSQNNRNIYCSQIGHAVAGDITECSDYRNMTQLSLAQMSELAVLIDPRGKPEGGYL